MEKVVGSDLKLSAKSFSRRTSTDSEIWVEKAIFAAQYI